LSITSLKEYWMTFWKYKELLKELVLRDLKVKYRRSVLGYIWSILNPLLMMIVISIFFSFMFRFQIDNYPVYLICGQVVYNFYSDATRQSMNSILHGGALIKKVKLPKYIFPIARTASSFINMLFSLVAVVLVMIITKAPLSLTILLFPLPLIYLFFISMGIGMILSVLVVYFRDIEHLYGVFLLALMYASPIFYPISILPPFAMIIIKFNPLYHIMIMFRDVMYYGNIPSLRDNIVCMAFAILSIGLGLIIFKKYQDNLVLNI
jgi:ABC-2 type transport system permease protein